MGVKFVDTPANSAEAEASVGENSRELDLRQLKFGEKLRECIHLGQSHESPLKDLTPQEREFYDTIAATSQLKVLRALKGYSEQNPYVFVETPAAGDGSLTKDEHRKISGLAKAYGLDQPNKIASLSKHHKIILNDYTGAAVAAALGYVDFLRDSITPEGEEKLNAAFKQLGRFNEETLLSESGQQFMREYGIEFREKELLVRISQELGEGAQVDINRPLIVVYGKKHQLETKLLRFCEKVTYDDSADVKVER